MHKSCARHGGRDSGVALDSMVRLSSPLDDRGGHDASPRPRVFELDPLVPDKCMVGTVLARACDGRSISMFGDAIDHVHAEKCTSYDSDPPDA